MRVTESQLRQFARQILLELRDAGGAGPPRAAKYFARPTGTGHVLYYTVGRGGGPKAIPGTPGQYYQPTYVEGAADHGSDSFSLSPEGLEALEGLVDMGLYQKKEQEVESPNIAFKYRKDAPKGSPASKWKRKSDVPATKTVYEPINPEFEFLLVDTRAKLVSLDSSWSERRPRRGGGGPGGGSGSGRGGSYVMPSGDVGFVGATLGLQKLLKHLMGVDPRVAADYKVVSPDDKFRGKTIGDVAGAKRTTDVALGTAPGPLIAYHGTSVKRWPAIEKGGMKPGKFETPYSDQIPGYSEGNLYFTTDPHTAENYATRAAIWDKSTPLILKVEIPDFTRIVPDEDTMSWVKLSRPYTLTDSGGDTETLDDELHMSQAMRLVQQGGTEVKADSEFVALRREIEGQINSYLTKSVGSGLFAYRGPILPKFIRRWKEYPKKAYPKSVDTGEGGRDDDYERTRQEVLGKVKRYDEAALRRLVRMTLLEAESVGPFGEYLFGQDRGKPSRKNPEEDTLDEDELQDDLMQHYHGEMGQLTKWIDQLVDLEKQGFYTDVLSPPAGAQHAYRMMNNVKLENMAKILGYMPEGYEAGQMYEVSAGTFTPLPGRDHYSWTTDFGTFRKILKDWGRFTSYNLRGVEFLVFLRAPIAENSFLMNPRETKKLAGEYAYQSEVISVGPITCDHVWYVPMSSDPEFMSRIDSLDADVLKRVSRSVGALSGGGVKKR